MSGSRSSTTPSRRPSIGQVGPGEARLPGRRLPWRTRQVAHHARRARLRPRGRRADRRGPRATRRPTPGPTRASGTGRRLIVEKRFGSTGQFRIALNGGFRGHILSDTTLAAERRASTSTATSVTYGGGVSLRVLESLDLVAETYGTYLLGEQRDSGVKASNEVVGGIKLFVERNSYLMLGGGARYTDGFEAADQRAFLGFIFEPSIGDRDGDGIKDDVDKCPDDPEDFDGFQDEDGCPDPDNDNDGIPDVDDRCPNVPEDRDGDQDEDGCPEGSDGDRDGDGIPDRSDKCPDQPEDRDGFQDADGCPDPDNDKDGIPDKLRQVPERSRGQGRLRGRRTAAPIPTTTTTASPTSRTSARTSPRPSTASRTRTAAPTRGASSSRTTTSSSSTRSSSRRQRAEILPESNKILDAVATTLDAPPRVHARRGRRARRRARERRVQPASLTQDRVNSVVRALIARGLDEVAAAEQGLRRVLPRSTQATTRRRGSRTAASSSRS